MQQTLDHHDKAILDIIQTGFPLEPRPYAVIGEKLDLTEAEVLAKVRAMKGKGVIRRLGANFNSRGLGWKSTLCAAKVPEDKIDAFVEAVNRRPGATHNYLRKNRYNIWFTMIAPGMEDIEATLAEITAETGVEILNLPASRMFKIKVDFKMSDGE